MRAGTSSERRLWSTWQTESLLYASATAYDILRQENDSEEVWRFASHPSMPTEIIASEYQGSVGRVAPYFGGCALPEYLPTTRRPYIPGRAQRMQTAESSPSLTWH